MDLQGAPNLPQNISRASNDSQHHINIRLFKWAVKISMRKPDDIRVILIRASVAGSTATEVIAVPYSIPDMKGTPFFFALYETLKRFAVLGSLENIPWIAYDLLLSESALKFGLTNQLLARYSNGCLVMFFDLKINQSCVEKCSSKFQEMLKQECSKRMPNLDKAEEIEECIEECSRRMPNLSSFRVNADANLDKAEEIEECLKACPGMVVEDSRGMEEVKSRVEVHALTRSEEDDAPECPICWNRLRVGDRHAITCCRHKFHKVCMVKWLIKRKRSCPYCPVCRNSLYFVDF